MEKLSYISQDLFSAFTALKDGQVKVPDTLEVYQKINPIEKAQKEISELEKELATVKKPDDKELIELGKMHSDYYCILELIGFYQNEIKRLTEIVVKDISK
jgi:preprotein translocase subunit Sss1